MVQVETLILMEETVLQAAEPAEAELMEMAGKEFQAKVMMEEVLTQVWKLVVAAAALAVLVKLPEALRVEMVELDLQIL